MKFNSALLILGVAAATSLSAATITIDFEGVGDNVAVGNFYSPVASFTANPSTQGLVKSSAGGSGNIGGLPTPVTGMYYLAGSAAIMNIGYGGLDTSGDLTFYYSAPNGSSNAVINLYAEAGGYVNEVNNHDLFVGDGNWLDSFSLAQTLNNNQPPMGQDCTAAYGVTDQNAGAVYCPFQLVTITAATLASYGSPILSIDFGGTANQVVYDSISFSYTIPEGGDTPEPGTMFLLGSGLLGIGFGARKFKLKKS